MSNKIEAAFSEFCLWRAVEFPGVNRDQLAVIFYAGVHAGFDIAHAMRMEGIERKYGPIDAAQERAQTLKTPPPSLYTTDGEPLP